MVKQISVIGAGTMGGGIAHLFALKEFNVSLIDIFPPNLEKGLQQIHYNLKRQAGKGTISEDSRLRATENIRTFTNYEEGVAMADLVIEAATENEKTKLDIFNTLDTLCPPRAILASNTSSISITKIASATKRPDKVIGMHFMNPVPLMKLVEVIKGYQTSEIVFKEIMQLALALDKTPVEVNDYPGFVANRILMPMINEAIIALQEDVAGVIAIDTVMKQGMSHPMGPLELADFIGLDICLSILKILYQGFGNPKYAPSPLLVNMVEAGHIGVKSGEGFYSYQPGSKEKNVASRFLRK
jgi:3-hydroxybutyryl-CoA dehydrogenase